MTAFSVGTKWPSKEVPPEKGIIAILFSLQILTISETSSVL